MCRRSVAVHIKFSVPSCMLKADEDVFLDGMTLSELENELGAPITKVENDGYDLLGKILGGE